MATVVSMKNRLHMMGRMYPLGAIPSVDDPRDYGVAFTAGALALATAEFPDFIDIPDTIENYDQSGGTCVMQSARYGWHRKYGIPFGVNMGYGLARPEGKENTPGLSMRIANDFIAKNGMAPEADDPGELEVPAASTYARRNKVRLLKAADPYKGWTYTRVYTVEEIKAALMDRRHITFRMTVSNYKTDKYGWFRGDGKSPKGEHAMVIKGAGKWAYSARGDLREGGKVRNSWGEKWGFSGDCYMTWADILRCREIYVWFPPKSQDITPKPIITPRRSLYKGKTGDDVKALQARLISMGYDLGGWGADGDFGDATDAAVRKYQGEHGLTVDGIVGTQTWGSFDKLAA